MQAGTLSTSRHLRLLAVASCLIGTAVPDAVAQTRRPRTRPPAQTAPIPGIPEKVPQAAQQAIQKRLQEQLSERDRRRAGAGRDAQALRRVFDANPQSETGAQTLYLAGFRFLEAHRWQPAQECFRELTDRFPESPYAHEARLALFDLAFEADLAPDVAEGILDAVIAWAETVESRPTSGPVVTQLLATPSPGQPLPLQPPGPPLGSAAEGDDVALRADHAVAADAHLRAGLLDWLSRDAVPAREHFRQAFRLDPSPHSPVRLLAHAVVNGRPHADTPAQATEGDASIGRLIRYADVIHNSLEMYRAHRLWDALLTKRSRDLSPVQRSYVLFRRGHARFRFLNRLERDPDAVLKDYEVSRKTAPDAPWAAETLLLAGNVAWNLKRDPAQAVALWQTLLDEYPESPHAPRGAYFIGVAWEQSRDWQRAFRAFEDAQRRYPDSAFAELIGKHLKTVRGRIPRPSAPRTSLVPIPERKRSN